MSESTPDVRFPDVTVQLSGTDGNAFVVIGSVTGALRRAGHADVADEFARAVMDTGSYDEFLQTVMRWVDVR